MNEDLVNVEDLRIAFPDEETGQMNEVVKGISFSLGREKLGIVGESGSGKSLSSRALMGILPPKAKISAKRLDFKGDDLMSMSRHDMRHLRGDKIGMILQDPKYSLNPVMPVGQQILESIRAGNRNISKSDAKQATLDILDAVQIRDADRVFRLYPHEVSGGMGQRIMIAMMLVRKPDLLIADEPTSALDVTVQNEVLSIMENLVDQHGMGLIFISHDLRLVSRFCDRILVMYAGHIVETLEAAHLEKAEHPYTQGLLNCMPAINGDLGPLPTLQRDPAWDAPKEAKVSS
jgi:peptide/nickel transport system ATP-binding protein